MRTLLNLLWLVFSGLWLAIGYVLAGVVLCLLIVTIPFGVACFRLAAFVLWPFGRAVVPNPQAGAPSTVANVLWFVLAGLWMALAHLVLGVVLCLTVIGILASGTSARASPPAIVPTLPAQVGAIVFELFSSFSPLMLIIKKKKKKKNSFRLAAFVLWPFGRAVVREPGGRCAFHGGQCPLVRPGRSVDGRWRTWSWVSCCASPSSASPSASGTSSSPRSPSPRWARRSCRRTDPRVQAGAIVF